MHNPNHVNVPILGIAVTPMTALETAVWATEASGKRLLLNHNLHSAYCFQSDEEFRQFYERADRVVIDGAPIKILARLRDHRITASHRIGSTDWIAALSETQSSGTLLVYGAAPESNRLAVQNLREQLCPGGWKVEGLDGYTAETEAVQWLRDQSPTLVIVGLGMPLQERFLHRNWDILPDATYATVGGAIDYVAGTNQLAPRWLGDIGLEWAWRLAHAPRRLAHRYLVEPLKLAWLLLAKRARRTFTSAN